MNAHTKPPGLNFLFATWEGGGSVGPVLTVAAKLVRRGHRVRVMSDACNRPEVQAAGAAFAPWTRAPSRTDKRRESDIQRDYEAASPAEGLLRVVDGIMAGPALAYAQDVMEALAREPADLVIAADLLPGVGAGCEAAGQPFVIMAANICLMPLEGAPPFGGGFAPADGAEVLEQVRQGALQLLDHGLPALNRARAALGLKPLAHLMDQALAARALLLATSEAFDFPWRDRPAFVRYVGPQLDDPSWAAPWTSPWPADDARPLALVSFSTTFQDHVALLQRVIDALAPLPVRVLLTTGAAIEPEELTAAANTLVVKSAPHNQVMRQAGFAVTHGGHGTLARALINGLPQLVVPQGRDQNDNARRVAERGAGLSLEPTATVEEIRAAFTRLLAEPGFAFAARRLGARVAEDVASPAVVEELEAAALAAAEVAI
jgi:UDP:flavonoid glycosyltransferase YjiC (YdhE family)